MSNTPVEHTRSRTTGTLSTGSELDRELDELDLDDELHQGLDDRDDASSRMSGVSGADTDASLRRIAPSTAGPPSVISRAESASNASFAPTQHTFKSYVSTKPTTPSLDSGGANRIAVAHSTVLHPAPVVATAHHHGMPPSSSLGSIAPEVPSPLHSGTGPGITFSALPASVPGTPVVSPSTPTGAVVSDPIAEGAQAPRHTLVHPRNNPNPAAPPPDNASMLTLASSTFAPSIALSRGSTTAPAPAGPSTAAVAGPSGSWGGGGLTSLRAWKRGDEGVGADEDASVRVLAGSRRASDESFGGKSTWSAPFGRAPKEGGGAASVRTVGTTGTGGELLNPEGLTGESNVAPGGIGSGGPHDSLELQAAAKRASLSSETEAQRVVRKEGARDELQAREARAEAGSDVATAGPVHASAATPTTLTPKEDLAESPLVASAAVPDTASNVVRSPPPVGLNELERV